jgi:putative ABC transport system ATP-binding protein
LLTLKLAAVSKAYGTQAILDQAELEIGDGELLAIMGRSGSGKSTLLKLLGTIETPDSGSVRFRGRPLERLTERERTDFRRRELGFVFQFFNLIPTLTLDENVRLPLALNGFGAARGRQRVADVTAELGLDGLGDRFPDQLSGGEQQRAAIARALVHSPALILADEPTGNLDHDSAEKVLDSLTTACRQTQTTLVLATHSREAAARADRIVRIDAGKLLTVEP